MPEQAVNQNRRNWLQMLAKPDYAMGVAVVGVVLMLIIPLPPVILDILLILNITLSLIVILATIYIKKPSDFNTFPTLILLTTIFGLALNVSSTRLILSEAYAGNIIDAFGNFVVKDNLILGLIIYIVIIAIQMMVITKGSGRVAEVAARFSLDKMPAKQMEIQSKLQMGIINKEEAGELTKQLELESEFYGSMDGSAKFISGNMKVAIVVMLVDIIGGLIVGIAMKGFDFATAGEKYIMLTVGDGLVSQIPAMLVSTATGIIVTRAGAEDFSGGVTNQLGSSPVVLMIAGGAIFVMGLLPGFPTLLNFLIGGLFITLGILSRNSQRKAKEDAATEKKSDKSAAQATTHEAILNVDPMSLEIGYGLIPMVDKEQGGDLLERIVLVRKSIGLDLGILVPKIRIMDDVGLEPMGYRIRIRGTEIEQGKVMANRLMALNGDLTALEGIEVLEPSFGLPAKWIKESERSKAEALGFDIFDPVTVLITHLTEVIRKNAPDLLTREDVNEMLKALDQHYPTIVKEARAVQGGIGMIQKVLQNLLSERVSVRNLVLILEAIADYAPVSGSVDKLTESVRVALKRQIASQYADNNNNIRGIGIDPDLERAFAESITETKQGMMSTIPPQVAQRFAQAAAEVIGNVRQSGKHPIIFSTQRTRPLVREILGRGFADVPVISFAEIPSNFGFEQIGIIRLS